MPQLIKGHIKFTEEDFLYSDYNEHIKTEAQDIDLKTPMNMMCQVVQDHVDYLQIVSANYVHLPTLPDTIDYVKEKSGECLSDTLESLLVLANKYGFTLQDLLKMKI